MSIVNLWYVQSITQTVDDTGVESVFLSHRAILVFLGLYFLNLPLGTMGFACGLL